MDSALQKRLAESFRCAFAGLAHAARTQPNLRIHVALAVLVVGLAVLLRVPAAQTAVLFLAIAGVIGAELMNTAVEALVDLVNDGPHPQAGIVKDVAAASVLVMVVAAVLCGLWILGPPLAGGVAGLLR
ncbi:MAG: diacylglycerol kinase family protein [Armatimonadetes bacterium]|nr:diacylglycerol kinase family protein [Armatimonadota bacterium]